MAGDAANPELDLREQLRVGVRMLEALEVQLGVAVALGLAAGALLASLATPRHRY